MPSKRLIPLTDHGGEEPVLQYSPMCSVWALTTYDACDIHCSYCASYAQGPSQPRATPAEVRRILAEVLPSIPRDHTICLGAIIDCYTHAEAEHGVTRAALEVLVADERELVIVTKGTLIERDLDLLGGYPKVSVNVSLPSLDQAVLDDIEPHAPSGADRFATIERLADAGVDVQLHVQPWIPGMTDALALVEAAAGRFKVWVAPLNIQNPAIARSRWGLQFTQREINEAYVAEMKRVGPRENVTWGRPLWLGDDLLTLSKWGVTMAECALDRTDASATDTDDLLQRPLPVRSLDAVDRTEVAARDLATTSELLNAISLGHMATLGMATLSAHLRVYNAPYPARAVELEGPELVGELVALVAAMDDPDLRVTRLDARDPVVEAAYTVEGTLTTGHGAHAAGERVAVDVTSTYRYDNYGLLIEQWIEMTVRPLPHHADALAAT